MTNKQKINDRLMEMMERTNYRGDWNPFGNDTQAKECVEKWFDESPADREICMHYLIEGWGCKLSESTSVYTDNGWAKKSFCTKGTFSVALSTAVYKALEGEA